jgi:spermidine synthase
VRIAGAGLLRRYDPGVTVSARRVLPAVVLASGAASLATEICASRLLAPYFGNSTVVWANVIGLILIYLSVGYWLGGRIADRHPTPRALGTILVAAALCVSVLPFVARPFLSLVLGGLNDLSVGVVAGSFFATLALFSVPVSLLGMASPYALRLSISDIAHAGSTSGRLSSLATVGAIIGTFGSALGLIPAIGTQRTLLVAALLVALVSVPLLVRQASAAAVLIAGLIAVPPSAVKPSAGVLAERETAYQYVQVARDPDGKLVMRIDDGVSDQSVYRRSTVLTGAEWDMPLVVPPLIGGIHHVLVIGNAGGTTARALTALYPGVSVDGVELDPEVSALGREYMGMAAVQRLRVFSADGRAYLRTTSSRYDLIVIDAYRETYIPFYLATREFFQLVRQHLNARGAVALNVERVPGDDRLVHAVAGTVATVFAQTLQWPALRFNAMVLGLNQPLAHAHMENLLLGAPQAVQPLVAPFLDSVHTVAPSGDPLTDDRAPVEWLTDRALLAYIAAGGRLNEQLLPTAP